MYDYQKVGSGLMEDLKHCASCYLMFRYIFRKDKQFCEGMPVNRISLAFDRKPVKTADDLIEALEHAIQDSISKGKTALALSGGIDSAILARLMPAGTKAYTFRCIVPGKRVTDESEKDGSLDVG